MAWGAFDLSGSPSSSVPSSRAVNTTAPLTGGGPLSADLTLGVNDVSNVSKGVVPAIALAAAVLFSAGGVSATWTALSGGGTPLGNARQVNTTAPLSGGGALSADLTLSVADVSNVSKGVVPSVGAAGTVPVSSGTAAAWGVNFAAQTLTTTGGYNATGTSTLSGPVNVGTVTPRATTGAMFRVGHQPSAIGSGAELFLTGRNQANSADVPLICWGTNGIGGNDILFLGDLTNTNATVARAANSVSLIVGTSTLQVTTISVTTNQSIVLNPSGAASVLGQSVTAVNAAGKRVNYLAGNANSSGGGASTAVGGNVNLQAGSANGGATNTPGDTYVQGGLNGAQVQGNVSINAENTSWQGMQGGIFVANRAAAPAGNPTAGGYLYAEAGALKWRGSAGTPTTIAPA